MIYKDSNERIEEIFFNVVKKPVCIV